MFQDFRSFTFDLFIESYVNDGFLIGFVASFFLMISLVFRLDKTLLYPAPSIFGVGTLFGSFMHILGHSLDYEMPVKLIVISLFGTFLGVVIGLMLSRFLKPLLISFKRKQDWKKSHKEWLLNQEKIKKHVEEAAKERALQQSIADSLKKTEHITYDDYDEEFEENTVKSVTKDGKNPFELEFDFDEK